MSTIPTSSGVCVMTAFVIGRRRRWLGDLMHNQILLLGKPNTWPDVHEMTVCPGASITLDPSWFDTSGRLTRIPAGFVPGAWFNIETGRPRTFRVTFYDGEAFCSPHLSAYLIREGLVRRGTAPNPKPQFEQVRHEPATVHASTVGASGATANQSGLSHGAAATDIWARWVTEVTP